MWLVKGMAFVGLMALGLVLLLSGIAAVLVGIGSIIDGAYLAGTGWAIVGLVVLIVGWRLVASRIRRSKGRPVAQKPRSSSGVGVHAGVGKPSKPSKTVNVVWCCLIIGSIPGSVWIAVRLFSGFFALLVAGAMILAALVLLEIIARWLISLGLLAPINPVSQPARTAGKHSAAGIPPLYIPSDGNSGGHGGHGGGGDGGGFFGGGHGGGGDGGGGF